MNSSPEIGELCAALSLAQAKFKTAVKNKKNPHFRSSYADLDSIMEAVREPLAANGLCVVQGVDSTPERLVRLTTRLIHKSGQWIESCLDLRPDKDGPQQIGSAITYGRRYGVSAMLGITTDEDDDGNAAHGHPVDNHQQQALMQADQRVRAEMAKRKAAFVAKAQELGVAEPSWPEIAKRLKDTGRSIEQMQYVLDDMECERNSAKEEAKLKETF